MGDNTPNNIFELTAQLDYSIERTQDRLAKLRDIIEVYDEKNERYFPAPFFVDYFTNYFNPHISQSMNPSEKLPVCLSLSYIAGYLLFNKEENNDDVIKEKTQKYRDTKHTSLEYLIEGRGEENLPQSPPAANYKQVRPRITDNDRATIPPLAELNVFISALAKQMEEETDAKEKYRLKKILIEARQDQYAIKEGYNPTIRFSSPLVETTTYVYDEDTRYKREDGLYQYISRNTIDFGDPKHVYQLLNHYSQLRHQHYDDPHSDMRYILDSLEEYVSRANLNNTYRYIMIRRIDGATYADISKELQQKHGQTLSVSYLSYLFVNDIPKKITQAYEQSHEDWYYINKEKGDYKKCGGPCGRNKLRTNKYFSKDKKSKDGLSSVCKECRRTG